MADSEEEEGWGHWGASGGSLREKKKEWFLSGSFARRPHVAHMFDHSWWRLVVVGGGWWRLVVVGGGWWRLVVGGWWSLGPVLKGGP